MAGKRDKPEDVVLTLRQAEVLQGQGMAIADAVRSPFTAYSATRELNPASWFLRFFIVSSPRSWRTADVRS
jgi:hypothetical protein